MDIQKLRLASDIEAKGLYDDVHTKDDVHCLCSVDIDTDEVLLFHDHPEFDGVEVLDPYDNKTYIIPKRTGSLDDGIKFWEKVATNGGLLIIHNAHTYDRPVIDKVWSDNQIPFESYWDTFVQSKVQWFERPCPKGAKSAHGLKAYGIKFGINKPEVKDWKTIDAFKLHRCIEDCKIQKYTYLSLEKERLSQLETYSINFIPALKIESLYAAECFIQEDNGALVDVDHIKRCIKDLDSKIEKLREEIEPNLPPVIKGSGSKVAVSEMAELFGYDGSKVKDKIIKRKRNGEIEEVVEKPYFKPIMNFTRSIKSSQYSGFHLEHGISPVFEKRKELTDWIKDKYPLTKPKQWQIDKEEVVTKVLNKNTCEYFGLEEDNMGYVCGPFTKIEISKASMTQTDVVKSYLITLGWKHAEDWNLKEDVYGRKIKVDCDTEVRWPLNAHPDNQLVKYIKKGGYLVSSPKLTEDDYDQLPEGMGKKIAEYNTYQHRRRFLENPNDPENKGLLSYVREDGRIPCGINNFATRSGRGAQRVWVNAPGKKSLYGKEIRKCIIAPPGKKLLGADMKSAQLSIAAYYANNYDYYNNVATGIEKEEDGTYVGTSAHCVNARMFGLVSESEWKRAVETQDKDLIEKLSIIRDGSKGGSFCVIFGGSGKKVAVTIKIPEKEGHKRREQFLRQMGLEQTIKRLEEFERKYPYKGGFMLPLAFGYWLWNNSSHKSVNTIVQGFEALAQKLAVVRVAKEVRRLGLEDKVIKILDYHDEGLYEIDVDCEAQAGKIIGEAYTWAAHQIYQWHLKYQDHFANYGKPLFSIDLNGGYDCGLNYGECH